MLGWQFLRPDGTLGYGNDEPVEVGKIYKYTGRERIKRGVCGLHASERIIDALEPEAGHILCRLSLYGQMRFRNDDDCEFERQAVARVCYVLSMVDCASLLHKFAALITAENLKAHQITDKRCWHAAKTKLRYAYGVATSDELQKAKEPLVTAINYESVVGMLSIAMAMSAWCCNPSPTRSAHNTADAARCLVAKQATTDYNRRTNNEHWIVDDWARIGEKTRQNNFLTTMVNNARAKTR